MLFFINSIWQFLILSYLSLGDIVLPWLLTFVVYCWGFIAKTINDNDYTNNIPNQFFNKHQVIKHYSKIANYVFLTLTIIGISSCLVRGAVSINQTKHATKNQISTNMTNYLEKQTKRNLPHFEKQWFKEILQNQKQYY